MERRRADVGRAADAVGEAHKGVPRRRVGGEAADRPGEGAAAARVRGGVEGERAERLGRRAAARDLAVPAAPARPRDGGADAMEGLRADGRGRPRVQGAARVAGRHPPQGGGAPPLPPGEARPLQLRLNRRPRRRLPRRRRGPPKARRGERGDRRRDGRRLGQGRRLVGRRRVGRRRERRERLGRARQGAGERAEEARRRRRRREAASGGGAARERRRRRRQRGGGDQERPEGARRQRGRERHRDARGARRRGGEGAQALTHLGQGEAVRPVQRGAAAAPRVRSTPPPPRRAAPP